MPADAAPPLTTHQVSQLQRMLGNRATTILIGRGRPAGAAGDTTTVQRAKPGQGAKKDGAVLPGRSKRMRAVEHDELAAMEQANLAWEAEHDDERADPSHNPFSVLPIGGPGPAMPAQPAGPARPTFDALRRAGSSVAALRELLVPYYGEARAGQMSRVLRTGKPRVTTIEGLEAAAAGKAAEHAARDEAPARTSAPGQSLNVRTGKPVPNLAKGTGDGFRAGVRGAWHVHYDHVKYGSNGATRVNFTNRQASTIEQGVTAALGLTPDVTGYDACRVWMNANLGTRL
jgi:hypothetical protein